MRDAWVEANELDSNEAVEAQAKPATSYKEGFHPRDQLLP